MTPQEPMSDEEFLQHYGVKGMKWGVRRSQAQLDRAAGRKASTKRVGSKRKTSSATPASSLDDATLRKRINRLQMEKQYNELTGQSTQKGKSFTRKVLGTAVSAIVVTRLTKGGNAIMDRGEKYVADLAKRGLQTALGYLVNR